MAGMLRYLSVLVPHAKHVCRMQDVFARVKNPNVGLAT